MSIDGVVHFKLICLIIPLSVEQLNKMPLANLSTQHTACFDNDPYTRQKQRVGEKAYLDRTVIGLLCAAFYWTAFRDNAKLYIIFIIKVISKAVSNLIPGRYCPPTH